MMKKRTKAVLEIAIVFTGILLFTWCMPANHDMIEKNRLAIIALLAFTLFYLAYISPCLIFDDTLAIRGLGTWRTFFIRTDNFKTALKGYATITLIASVVIVGFTLLLRPAVIFHFNWQIFFIRLLFYVSSAFAQELLFISWLLMRLRTVVQDDLQDQTGSKRLLISLVAATMAFFLHAPNLPVMCISFVSGFAIIWVSYATPNLFLAVSCHALLGTLLLRVAEIPVKFGPAYMLKDFHFFQTLLPITKKISNKLF